MYALVPEMLWQFSILFYGLSVACLGVNSSVLSPHTPTAYFLYWIAEDSKYQNLFAPSQVSLVGRCRAKCRPAVGFSFVHFSKWNHLQNGVEWNFKKLEAIKMLWPGQGLNLGRLRLKGGPENGHAANSTTRSLLVHQSDYYNKHIADFENFKDLAYVPRFNLCLRNRTCLRECWTETRYK